MEWLVWIAVFVAYEFYAYFNRKPGDTFSERVWDWFAIRRPGARFGTLRRLMLAGFLGAIYGHFVYDAPVTFVIVFAAGMGWSIWFFYRREVRR